MLCVTPNFQRHDLVTSCKVTDERKRLKWFAEASVLCKRKQAPTDLRKFDDLYGEKWKINDCGLIRTLAQKPQPLPESYVNAACNAVGAVLIGGGENGPMPFFYLQ